MKSTDWDAYYSRPLKTASITRRFTANLLCRLMGLARKEHGEGLDIIELGGANSCFYDQVCEEVSPKTYSILDSNELGLELFRKKKRAVPGDAIAGNVLFFEPKRTYSLVYSVGLIEHFDRQGTARSIKTHLDLVAAGGFLILFFPTPTWLYRITRHFSEMLGLWIFHDERPLRMEEVMDAIPPGFERIASGIHWKIFLTQGWVVLRKTG